MKKLLLPVTTLIFLSMNTFTHAQNLAAQLGYKPDARLLIVHADDAGLSQATNEAIHDAFTQEVITSSSIIVNAPWYPGIAAYWQENPNEDFGIHLTLTSEWHHFKWGSIAPDTEVPSLLTDQGYFYATHAEAVENIAVDDVEQELRAQIEKVRSMGLQPTHFDSHMAVLYANEALYELYLRLGREYRVAVMAMSHHSPAYDSLVKMYGFESIAIDHYLAATPEVAPQDWETFYNSTLAELKPGLNLMIVHPAYLTPEMTGITSGHDYYDATWRQRDIDYLTSEVFAEQIRKNNIILITWDDVRKIVFPE